MQMISSPNHILDVLIVGGGSLGIEMAYQMLKKKMKLYKKLKIGLVKDIYYWTPPNISTIFTVLFKIRY